MEQTQQRKRKSLGLLLVGAIFVILSIYLMTQPLELLFATAWIIGALILLQGIAQLIFKSKIKYTKDTHNGTLVVLGIINIILGLIILFNVFISAVLLAFIFAVWVLITSVGELIMSSHFKDKSGGLYWTVIILGVIGLILGIALLFNPVASALTLSFLISLSLLILGFQMVIRAISV